MEGVEELISALQGGSVDYSGFIVGLTHQFLPVDVDLFESLGVVGQLLTDILRLQEDGLEPLPVLLDLKPDLDDEVDLSQSLLPVVYLFLEFFDVLAGLHGHEVHLVSFDVLNDLVHCAEHEGVSVLFELEFHDFPSRFDLLELGLNLSLFLCSVHELVDVLCVLVEFELDEIFKAEVGALEVDGFVSDALESFPMSFHHEG